MSKYELSAADIKLGINRVLTEAFASATVSENPKIIYITSGQGGGKTSMALHKKRELKEEGIRAYGIDSDKIAEFHPYNEDLMEELPDVWYEETRKFVRPATPLIFEGLMRSKITLICEKVFNKGEKDFEQIRTLKEYGYKVEVNVIATDLFESRLSCYEREAAMLIAGLQPRGTTTKEKQIKLHNAFVRELGQIEQMGLCDEINVYIRGENINKPPILKYSTLAKDNKYKSFQEAIKEERRIQREKLVANPADYLVRIENARKTIQEYGTNPELTQNAKNGLNELQQDFIIELGKEEVER